MAQSVERFTRNEQVISSNLITSSKKMTESVSVIFLSKPKRSVGLAYHQPKAVYHHRKTVYIITA